MSEEKPGEMVHVFHEQLDAEGNKLSEVDLRWYGFNNAEANKVSMMLVAAVEAVANQLADEKSKPTRPTR